MDRLYPGAQACPRIFLAVPHLTAAAASSPKSRTLLVTHAQLCAGQQGADTLTDSVHPDILCRGGDKELSGKPDLTGPNSAQSAEMEMLTAFLVDVRPRPQGATVVTSLG